jgi:hypothetical protein
VIEAERQRRVALVGGLSLLGLANYLDLVGVLRVGLEAGAVSAAAGLWTIAIFAAMDYGPGRLLEVRARLDDLLLVTGGTIWMVVVARVLNPDVGTYYLFHATAFGQLVVGVGPAIGLPTLLLVIWFIAGRLAEYIRLRRTTPEERVLENRM